MSDGQIDKLVDTFRACVRKHQDEFPRDAVQRVLGLENLGMDFMPMFRQRVEQFTFITRTVAVDRSKPPLVTLEGTECAIAGNKDVIAYVPIGEGAQVEAVFFKIVITESINKAAVMKEYDFRKLSPLDPYALCAVNASDKTFAELYPNTTLWQSWRKSEWHCIVFRRDIRCRFASLSDSVNYGTWSNGLWFGGVRQ